MMCLIIPPERLSDFQVEDSVIARLEPRLLNDGTYALPDRVTVDPQYSDMSALFATLTKRDVSLLEFHSDEI